MVPHFEEILTVPHPTEMQEISIGFDDRFTYIATPNGMWRTDIAFESNSQLAPVPATGKGHIHSTYMNGDSIFVLKDAGSVDGHTFIRSRDRGDTFEPLDGALEIRSQGPRSVLVPTRMAKTNNALFVNAGSGRNIFVSVDDSVSWQILNGEFQHSACYPGKFLVRGRTVITGGECPLDSAYLLKGTLTKSLTGWTSPLQSVAPEDLSNRNIQFITALDDWNLWMAGVEGGMLRSQDAGAHWEWVIRYEQSSASYPYIKQCSLIPGVPNGVLAGGFDKADDDAPFLAISMDRGRSWTDISESIRALGKNLRQIPFIAAHPDGRLLVATYSVKDEHIIIAKMAGSGSDRA